MWRQLNPNLFQLLLSLPTTAAVNSTDSPNCGRSAELFALNFQETNLHNRVVSWNYNISAYNWNPDYDMQMRPFAFAETQDVRVGFASSGRPKSESSLMNCEIYLFPLRRRLLVA